MTDDMVIRVLGDFGPFSKMGKSIGYEIKTKKHHYLLDCGAPLFHQIGGDILMNIQGLILTHCHDDHKRWFTDLVLFNMYECDLCKKVLLLTSEDIYHELVRASGPSLDRSLSQDSKNIIDVPFEQYMDYRIIGPYARYRLVSHDEGAGKTGLYITDRDGNTIGPDKAKIVISQKTQRPRMLFRDPEYNEWVEPESFYPFSSSVFYEDNRNTYHIADHFTVDAMKSPVWHGIPTIGIKIKKDAQTLIFSSDTVNDIHLWKQLYSEKRTQTLPMKKKEFETSSVIYGDINDYIERVWSEQRYREAVKVFHEGNVIHDVSDLQSIVHTDYKYLKNTLLEQKRTLLTHGPDLITSEWMLADTEKSFVIKEEQFFEIVDDELYPMNADIYHKDEGKYFVGYQNEKGTYMVYEKNGMLGLTKEEKPGQGQPLYKVDLYEDIGGRYFPRIEDSNTQYYVRSDGKVERLEYSAKGSRGHIIECHRKQLSQRSHAIP
jgi:hypothetical protein